MILLMVDDEPIIIQTLARSISIESLNIEKILLAYSAEDAKSSIVIRDSRFVNEFHILKATCKFCTRLSTFVMTFPFFPLLL